jgi:hypothetical protein
VRVETFVVQLFAPAEEIEAGRGCLPGFVEHVGSGRREAFREAGELLAFLRRAARPTGTGGSSGPSMAAAPLAPRRLLQNGTNSGGD